MPNREKMILCGGTFFTLLLEARKPLLGANDHYAGKKDGLNEFDTLFGLGRIINADLPEPMETEKKTVIGNTSEYKKCESNGGGFFPFSNSTAIRTFDSNIKNKYQKMLERMDQFISRFIDVGGDTKKDEALVKALVDLVDKDTDICEEQEFYINSNGTTQTKKQIKELKKVEIQPFLLGIFHYAMNVENTVGKETFNAWCPAANRSKRIYKGTMGIDWPDIEVEVISIPEKVREAEIVDDILIEDDTQKENTSNESKMPSNNMVFNFNVTGSGNQFIQHVDTINNNYYGGKKEDVQ